MTLSGLCVVASPGPSDRAAVGALVYGVPVRPRSPHNAVKDRRRAASMLISSGNTPKRMSVERADPRKTKKNGRCSNWPLDAGGAPERGYSPREHRSL
jgi:hypothetical protein